MKLKLAQRIIIAIQKILIVVLLFFTYIFGFGLTFVLIMLFNRRFFNMGHKRKDSFWIKARGYACDAVGARRQS